MQAIGLLVTPRAGVTDLRTLGLNERQVEALQLMVNEGRELSNKEYRETFGISRPTAVRDLSKLVKTGWVQEIGKVIVYAMPQDEAIRQKMRRLVRRLEL